MGTRLRGHQYAEESKAKLVDQQPVARTPMQKPPLDPDVADTAPSDPVLTVYDEEHLITYLRLLDAEVDGADWRDVARIVLHINPEHESDRARRAVRQPFIARQLDDGARLPARATWWCVRLKMTAPRNRLLVKERLRTRSIPIAPMVVPSV